MIPVFFLFLFCPR